MARPSSYSAKLRRRAVCMVARVRPDYETEWAGMKAVASKLGIGTAERCASGPLGPDRLRVPARDGIGRIRPAKTVSYVVRRRWTEHGPWYVELDRSGRAVGDRGAADPTVQGAGEGGGTQDTPDETLFAAIIYVLVSGCAWRVLPPCFGISKSTAHRRFLIWSRAGVWGRLHEAILHRLYDEGLLDLSRAVLDSAHGRAKKGADRQVRAPWTGVSRVPRCTSCRTRTDCPWSSASQQPTSTTASR